MNKSYAGKSGTGREIAVCQKNKRKENMPIFYFKCWSMEFKSGQEVTLK